MAYVFYTGRCGALQNSQNMDELISEYNNLTKEYLLKLTDFYAKNPKVNIPKNSTFKTEGDYLRFRSNSLMISLEAKSAFLL